MGTHSDSAAKLDIGYNDSLKVLSLSQEWVGILNRRREILWVNPAWSSGLGMPIEQINGRIFDDLIHASEHQLPAFELATPNSPPLEFNLSLRGSRGDAVELHWRLTAQDNHLFLNGHIFNSATPKPSDPYLAAFEYAPIGIVHLDLDGHLLRVNRRFCELVGYSKAELMHLTMRDLTPPEDFPTYNDIMTRLLIGETTCEERDGIHIHKDGTRHWMHMTGTLIRDKNDAPDYFMVTVESSQARKEMEQALYDGQVRYRMVADYTYDWEFWQRPDKSFEYVSPSVERITGYTAAEFMDDPLLLEHIIVPEDVPDWIIHVEEDTLLPPERTIQFRIRHKTGAIRWVEHICVPIFENGVYLGRRASNRDITERITSQLEIEEQRRLLEAVFRAAPGYFYVLDVDTGQHILSNRKPDGPPDASDTGITASMITAIMHPDDLGQLPHHRKREHQLPDGVGYTFEFRLRNSGGGWDWIRAHEVVFLRRADGAIQQILGIANNITIEKEQDAALRESEARFRQMFEHHQAVKLLIDPTTGRIMDANPAAGKFYGWDVAALKTMRIQDINTLPDEQVRAEMQRAAAEQRDFFNFRHRLADGDMRDVEVHSAPVEVDGKTLLYSIIMDVTELHQTERALQESRNRFDAFMRNSPMAAYIKDLEGRLVYMNPVCARVFNLENVAWQNQTGYPLWDDSTVVRDTDKHNLVMGMTTIAEKSVAIAGEERIWLTHTFPIQDVRGQVFVGGMGVDITELKRAERQLIEMTLEHERMQILGHFIEKAAHEFRTPLSIIELGLHAMRDLADTPKHQGRVGRMEEQVFHIVKLVESMVTMTRLDSMTGLNLVSVGIQPMMRTLQERFVAMYPERAAHFNVTVPNVPMRVPADVAWLERAVFELLTNAHRFTPAEGQVSLEVREDETQVVIAVRDTGQGIGPEDQGHIFEHFYRADLAHTTRGFGLGLSMVKRVVEMHNGVLEFETTPGVGSVFRIILPRV